MRRSWLSAILCLLYLSAGTIFASIHHHSDDPLKGHVKCAACAWHADSVTDVPVIGMEARAPEFVEIGQQAEVAFAVSILFGSPNTRGPPLSLV